MATIIIEIDDSPESSTVYALFEAFEAILGILPTNSSIRFGND